MEQPYDLQFERSGDDVVLDKLEEFDVERRIHMEWNGNRAAQPFTASWIFHRRLAGPDARRHDNQLEFAEFQVRDSGE